MTRHKLSRHNILSKIDGSEDYFIINLLSRNADILNGPEARMILSENFSDVTLKQKLIDNNYFVDPEQESKTYKEHYLDFLDNRDSDEIQIFFASTYTCNFDCSYCYQSEYTNQTKELTRELIDAFFNYINTTFAGKQKYITLFGGEPLVDNSNYKKHLQYFFQKVKESQLSIAIVTNGYNISKYISEFKDLGIREIQITLDGPPAIHNKRRPLKNGQGTFKEISNGVDLLLENEIPVNLRVVVDKENLTSLVDLADYATEKGWNDSPIFKTQLGRNYELHTCKKSNPALYDRINLYQDLHKLIITHPNILKFHRPAYSISKFLFDNGALPDPLFDSCPGTKTEWAFDYTGRIYSCTATVGKEGESLGTFYPEISLNNQQIAEWQERDVTSIPECANCNLQLACGGGCASVAKNKTGKILSPDCRPVKELLELGIDLYFKKDLTKEK